MSRQLLLIALFGIILAGCGTQVATTVPATTTPGAATSATAAPTPAASQGVSPKAGAQGLLDEPLMNLQTSVDANDLAAAKTQFDAFHTQWETVEDGIKAAAPEAYTAIEGAMDLLKDELVRSAQPDVAKVRTALDGLRGAITTFIATQP